MVAVMDMLKEKDRDLLQAIFNEMQVIKKTFTQQNERRIGRAEFAKY